MDKQNFESKDRFPLSTQSLSFMQDMIKASAQLALIGGDNYILSGCVTTNNNVSDGIIVIDGEIMPFKGGAIVETITIIEETIPVSANGLTFENARIKRHAKFATGTGVNYYPWSNFKPLQTNKQLEEAKATVKYVDDAIAGIQAGSIPTGVIVMWGGSEADIPTGWVLCDGREIAPQVFVPNLSGKFIVGFNRSDKDYDTIRKTGGSKSVALSVEEMPSHNHNTRKQNENKPVKQGEWGLVRRSVAGESSTPGSMNSGGAGTEPDLNGPAQEISIPFQGENKPHENRPPYYVLAFIIKIDIKK